MVLLRLLIGLLKGLVVGALLGYGLAASGLLVPSTLVAYGAAAALGAVIACIAGRPIWAKGARIEVGMKALAGVLIAPALLYIARRWLTFELPFDLPALLGLGSVHAPVGAMSLTSYALVGAVLAGFFDADNDAKAADGKETAAPKEGARIAAASGSEADEDPLAALESGEADERSARGKS